MDKKLTLWAIFSFAFATAQSHAAWNSSAWKHYEKYPDLFSNSFTSTTWGSVQINSSRWLKGGTAATEVWVPNSKFNKGYMKSLVYLQGTGSKPTRAPILFFIPGIFTNLRDGHSYKTIEDFTAMGFHVVTFPNPWSMDFAGQGFQKNPGELVDEATVYLEVISDLVARLKAKDLVSDVHLWGSSYGGMITSIIASLDQQNTKSILSGTITIESPPISFEHAIKNVDHFLSLNEARYLQMGWLQKLRVANDYFWAKSEKDLTQESIETAPSFVVYKGFQERVYEMAKFLDKRDGKNRFPNKTKTGFRIQDYLNGWAPQHKELFENGQADMRFWLARFKTLGGNNLRIIHADNDLLNMATERRSQLRLRDSGIFKNDELMELRNGGHLGFVPYSWREILLRLSC